MKKIIDFFTPTRTLVIFIVFVLIYLTINYVSQKLDLSIRHKSIRLAQLFNFICFIPGTVVFLIISVINFKNNKMMKNRKNIVISSIPIIIIFCYYFYFIILSLYTLLFVDIQDVNA